MTHPLALVFGATGYTGREVVSLLRARGVETVAHVRPGSPTSAQWTQRFSALGATVDASEWTPSAIAAAIARYRPSVVFSLLGTTASRAKREGLDDAYERVDYGMTKMALDGCVAAGLDIKFVYLSAIGASERGSAYVRVRGRLEREIRETGIAHVIARPAFITGTDREESRPKERALAHVFEFGLNALAAIGIRGPRDQFGTLSGRELAAGLVALGLDDRVQAGIVGVPEIRAAGAGA